MGKVGQYFDRWVGRASAAYGLWPLIPAGFVAVLTGYLSSGVAWIAAYGPFGWLVAGLCGFIAFAFGAAILGYAREKWAFAQASRKWAKQADHINPMDRDFTDQRLLIADIAHPITGRVSDKTFTRCQLLGRSNVTFAGNTILSRCQFNDCDFVIAKDGSFIQNTLVMENVTATDCEIWQCTIFVSQAMFDSVIRPLEVLAITYENPKID